MTPRAASLTIASTSHYLARADRTRDQGSSPALSFKSFGAFVAGAADRAKLVAIPARATRNTGSAALEPAAIMFWSHCTQ